MARDNQRTDGVATNYIAMLRLASDAWGKAELQLNRVQIPVPDKARPNVRRLRTETEGHRFASCCTTA